MEKFLNDHVVEEMLSLRLPITEEFEKCSFILPDGKMLKMYEHYEAYRFLVVEQLAPCVPDAEQLLSDLGWIRYSWIGYITLPDKKPTKAQYKVLELVLTNISKYRDKISVQIQNQPRVFINYSLDDIPHIVKRIKTFYSSNELLP